MAYLEPVAGGVQGSCRGAGEAPGHAAAQMPDLTSSPGSSALELKPWTLTCVPK